MSAIEPHDRRRVAPLRYSADDRRHAAAWLMVGSDREAVRNAAPDDDAEIQRRAGALFQRVLGRTHLSSASDLSTLLAEEARTLGVDPLVLYLLDHEQRCLMPVPPPGAERREPLSVQGTMAGRSFSSNSIIELDDEATGRRLWLPLLDGTERLGVAEMTFPGRRTALPAALVALCERYAHLIAMLIANKDLYSDFFTGLRRRHDMSLASELLWELVPPQVLATDTFVLAAMLEPCYDIGGDAYDYAVNDDGILHLAVFDAMGHGLAAAGVAAFALSAYRHSRRAGETPTATYTTIDRAIAEQYPTSRFVTGLIAQLDLRSGRLSWVNAGHPPALLLRDGRLVKALDGAPSPPMGMQLATSPAVMRDEYLEPADMVLLYTDGLAEARRPDGELFSAERLGEFIERQAANGMPAPETLRGLRQAIIESGEGSLRDDATALLVEWRRGSEQALLPQTV
jgi:serine phosphatase RsbU (regulator of sigma subunit)